MDGVPLAHEEHEVEALGQSDEVEGDGSVEAADLALQSGRDLAWDGIHVHWGEAQSLPFVQAEANLGVRWLGVEAQEEGGRGAREEDGRGLDEEVCRLQLAADGHGVQEGEEGHGVRDQVGVRGSWGQGSP